MVALPQTLRSFKHAAEELLRKHAVQEILFSGGTYQLAVKEEEEPEWVFLQFEPSGPMKDGFCTCEQGREGACMHIATAYLYLFDREGIPLHQRFENSLWNRLCRFAAESYGTDLPKNRKGGFTAGKVKIKLLEPEDEALTELLTELPKETEETSIKFSQVSEEELQLWKKGRPSPQFAYELSFWSEFAKWLFLRQEEGVPYQISFDEEKNSFPKALHIHFPQVEAEFPLVPEAYDSILPALKTVQSPLKILQGQLGFAYQVRFDPGKGLFHCSESPLKDLKKEEQKGGVRKGHWIYRPGEGFVSLQEEKGEELPSTFSIKELGRYKEKIAHSLVGLKIHLEPLQLKIALSFDEEWTLHIEAYAHKPGDLKGARLFDDWLFLEGDGFYRLNDYPLFSLEESIPEDEVATFLTNHRAWIGELPGFHFHVSHVEAVLGYTMDRNGTLSFHKRTPEATGQVSAEFGQWLYLPGEGFFHRYQVNKDLAIQDGAKILAPYVASFIRTHRVELELVPHFWTEPAILGASLSLSVDEKNRILVMPTYQFRKGINLDKLRFFEEFIYVQEEGFCELPSSARLPETYSQRLVVPQEQLSTFLYEELPGLRALISRMDPRLEPPIEFVLEVRDLKEVSVGQYSLKLVYRTNRGEIGISSLINAASGRKRFLFLDAGMIDLHDMRFRWLKRFEDVEDDTITVNILELLRLNGQEPLIGKSKKIEELLQGLLKLEHEHTLDTRGLRSSLRPYQITGVQWLASLRSYGLSGLLCDDMGLGKTHEAMALMAIIYNARKKGKRRFLVLCPTSVMVPWQEKLAQYMPDLKVHVYHGIGREIEPYTEEGELLLTSYGIWRNDCKILGKINFDLAVFDEIQVAKNPRSRIHRALNTVNAKMRLGLTGTPIENYLWDLKALFDLVLPGYLHGEAEFRERYIIPIEKNQSTFARNQLREVIRPFILRRRKQDVLPELPAKTEEVGHCYLSEMQQQLYREATEAAKLQLVGLLDSGQGPIPYMHIFSLLTRLKQICDHPAIVLDDIEHYHKYESGKWDLFCELLTEAQNSGQKVVVFSHYLAMLDIMELHLQKLEIPYASIRGSTQNRAEELRRFNHDPECKVFLGSLQAVGLGVDLTAASVVIHYDRWWTAAREQQATDRVHRIGQTKGIQVFKLITLKTFEERIDELIRQKAALLEDVVGYDDQRLIKQLTREELAALLSF